MSYSDSRKTLEKMLPYLSSLEKGVSTKWNLNPHVSAKRFAYRVREALRIATLYPADYPQLAKAQAAFRIEIIDRSTVQAMFKGSRENLVQTTMTQHGLTEHGLETAERGPVSLAGEMTALRIVDAWDRTQPSNTPMHFPQANLDREELLRLYSWASKRTPPWVMLVADDGQLTLTPYTRDLDGLGWDPSDE